MPCILFRLWNTRAKVHAAVGLGETAPCLPLIFQRPRLFRRIQDALQSAETRITVSKLCVPLP